jgi:hypothetical protein
MKINTIALKAALQCASSDASRIILNSVLVEVHQLETIYVATDGKLICAISHSVESEETGTAVIPADFAADLCKIGVKAGGFVDLYADKSAADVITLTSCGMFAKEPGKYPNWRQVFPKAGQDLCKTAERGISTVTTDKAGKFWRTLDKQAETVFVAVGDGAGFLALPSIHRVAGKRSAMPTNIRATVYCMGVAGAEDLLKASKATSYFPV